VAVDLRNAGADWVDAPVVQDGNLISDLKKEVEDIPGLKEAQEIRKTAGQIKNLSKITKIFLLLYKRRVLLFSLYLDL
jgi:hypothetical protein